MNDDQTSNIADELVRIMSGQTENNLNPLQYMAQLKEQEAREAEMKSKQRVELDKNIARCFFVVINVFHML